MTFTSRLLNMASTRRRRGHSGFLGEVCRDAPAGGDNDADRDGFPTLDRYA
jgi:hypothetical protein